MAPSKAEHQKKESEREKRERQTWETLIKPIVKGYGLSFIIYSGQLSRSGFGGFRTN